MSIGFTLIISSVSCKVESILFEPNSIYIDLCIFDPYILPSSAVINIYWASVYNYNFIRIYRRCFYHINSASKLGQEYNYYIIYL